MFQIPLELLQKIHFALTQSLGSAGVTVGEIGKIAEQLQRLQPISVPPTPSPAPAVAEPVAVEPEPVVATKADPAVTESDAVK